MLVLVLVGISTQTAFSIPNNPSPQRIVSCMPNITEILFAIGLESRIVGVTLNCNYPAAAQKKEKVGRETINVEKVISLKPDLVVMQGSEQPREIEKLKKRNLPVKVINPQTVDGVMAAILELGRVTGNSRQAGKVVAKMQERLKKVQSPKSKVQSSPGGLRTTNHESRTTSHAPRVLVIVGVNPLVVAGGNNFIDDVVKTAGAQNAAAQLKAPYPQYSFEQLVRDDPDAVIVAKNVVLGEKEIYNDKRWQKLRAVKNKQVLVIDADTISRPGPRVIDAIEEIAGFFGERDKR
jgi:iron complex transport system substrate-binding protein